MIRLTPPARNKRHKVVFHVNQQECYLLRKAVTISADHSRAYPAELEPFFKQLKELIEKLEGLERAWKAHPDNPNHEVKK